jgi:hypothetical protein
METCVTGIKFPQTDHSVEECCCPASEAASYRLTVGWAPIPGCGRGLIACADVDAGTVLDVAPAVPVRDGEGGTVLRQYVFQCDRDDCSRGYSGQVKEAMVFGPMALCNHSDDPNASVCFEEKEGCGLQAELIALRDIAKGEEVTIRYTDSDWYKENRLF